MATLRVHLPAELDGASITRLADALSAATTGDGDGDVVLLEGSAGVFCRGLSLSVLAERADHAPAMDAFRRCLLTIRFASRPVVAVVDGEALAGGVGLAAACDVVLATTRATFALSELLLGLVPGAIFPLLVERMGVQRARRLSLCGRACGGAEAEATGLVDAVVAPDALDATVQRWTRLLRRGEAAAVGQLKRFSAEVAGLSLEAAIARGAALTLEAMARPAVRARLDAFESGAAPWPEERP